MGGQVATIIVEPRFLVREALASLMANLSYRVVCSVGAAGDIVSASVDDGYKLVVVGAVSAESAASEVASIRKLWPESKIMLLLESTLSVDIKALVATQIDGCLPLYVTADTLKSALDLIIVQDLRVMVLGGAGVRLMQRSPVEEEDDRTNGPDMAGSTAVQANGLALPASILGNKIANDILSYRKATLSERESQI